MNMECKWCDEECMDCPNTILRNYGIEEAIRFIERQRLPLIGKYEYEKLGTGRGILIAISPAKPIQGGSCTYRSREDRSIFCGETHDLWDMALSRPICRSCGFDMILDELGLDPTTFWTDEVTA
jgi:hypothetical protein